MTALSSKIQRNMRGHRPRLQSIGGQGEEEFGSLTLKALNPDLTAMSFDDIARNGQSHSGSGNAPAAFNAIVFLENVRKIFRRNARTGVLHADLNGTDLSDCPDRNR